MKFRTMWYSPWNIRSGPHKLAVYSLLGLKRTPPPVYKGSHDLRVLLKAFLTFHEITFTFALQEGAGIELCSRR